MKVTLLCLAVGVLVVVAQAAPLAEEEQLQDKRGNLVYCIWVGLTLVCLVVGVLVAVAQAAPLVEEEQLEDKRGIPVEILLSSFFLRNIC